MNRNTELHYKNTPAIDLKRSKFDMSHSIKTTFNAGDVIPIYVDTDILPGDTVQMDMASLVRMATPIYPIMDNLYADYYWFFVPHRLVWEHWAEFWGQNDDPWTQNTEYEIPMIKAPENGWDEGSLADYLTYPTKIDGIEVQAFALRAYCKIWNDWFRDENLKKNCHIYMDDTTRTGKRSDVENYDYVTDTELGSKPAKAAKMHDIFTSALPEPQKGPAVSIPLGTVATVNATENINFNIPSSNNHMVYAKGINSLPTDVESLRWSKVGGGPTAVAGWIGTSFPAGSPFSQNTYQVTQGGTASNQNLTPANLKAELNEQTATITAEEINGLYADLATATAATINSLRTAFAIQKYYENAGLHGTRYIEYIRSVFGVTSSDARMQRAEYLGGTRVPLNIDQIIQTSSTNEVSPQGNTAGFSCTINRDSIFTKSFEEHGTLMCIVTIRTEHTYQQGLRKMFTRRKWTDYYNPFFANLGEQAILNENIYAQGETVVDDDGNIIDKQAFGYQEAWADYRYRENQVTGYMRSNATGSLDVWHFADDYSSLPHLSSEWIDEPYSNIDRTIAVTSEQAHQFIADFYYKTYYTRPMPVYSVPGLIDHV